MLFITIPSMEGWDESREEFVTIKKEQTLALEHSLVSISKWEAKWCIPYLSNKARTPEMTIDYVKCMTLTQNVDPEVYSRLTAENLKDIKEYMDSQMTATSIYDDDQTKKNNKEPLSSELIYYLMIAFNIPFECQKWHLNRLLTLIRICDIKSRTPKKRSKREIMQRNAAINAQRRKKYNTRG